MAANRLLKKTGLYMIGNLSTKVVQALLIPVYAYFVLPEGLGLFDYYMIIANILTMVCFCAIWESVLRFGLGDVTASQQRRLKSTTVAFGFFGLALILLSSLLVGFFTSSWDSVSWVAFMAVSYGAATIWQYFARAEGEVGRYVTASLIGALVSFACTLALVCGARWQVEGLTLAYIASQMAIVIVIEHKVRALKGFRIGLVDRTLLIRMLGFSGPLIVSLSAMFLMTGFGRILITNSLGAGANGQYVFAMKFSAIITAVGSVFAMAAVEESILRIGKSSLETYFSDLLRSVFRVAVSVAALAMIPILFFYMTIRHTAYFASYELVAPFLLYAAFHIVATSIAAVFQVVRKTKYAALTTLIGLSVAAVLSTWTIQLHGLVGVAWSLAFGMLAILLTRWFIAKAMLDLNTPLFEWLLLISAFIVLAAAFGWSGPTLNWVSGTACSLAALFTFPLLFGLREIRGISDDVKDGSIH